MNREAVMAVLSGYVNFVPYHDTNNLKGRCPFHKGGMESDPSFFVYVGPNMGNKKRTGAAFCHTCGEGWGFITLLKKLGASGEYIDAYVAIADEFELKKPQRRELCFDVPVLPERILGVYDHCPAMLLRAGFSKETLKHYDIGFDEERSRITFPIRDHHGRFVGISGRLVQGRGPRYKIYESEFSSVLPGYHLEKSRIVWGLEKFYTTSQHFKLQSVVVVCEGFKAAMWLSQHGYQNVVCLLGGYCSVEQMTLLNRVTDELILFMDDDGPGRKFTNKLIPRLRRGFNLRIASYPSGTSGLSPDDLDGQSIKRAIEQSDNIYTWKWRENEHVRFYGNMERE